jgi:hypothetical protein
MISVCGAHSIRGEGYQDTIEIENDGRNGINDAVIGNRQDDNDGGDDGGIFDIPVTSIASAANNVNDVDNLHSIDGIDSHEYARGYYCSSTFCGVERASCCGNECCPEGLDCCDTWSGRCSRCYSDQNEMGISRTHISRANTLPGSPLRKEVSPMTISYTDDFTAIDDDNYLDWVCGSTTCYTAYGTRERPDGCCRNSCCYDNHECCDTNGDCVRCPQTAADRLSAILSSVFGSVFGICLIICLVWCCCRMYNARPPPQRQPKPNRWMFLPAGARYPRGRAAAGTAPQGQFVIVQNQNAPYRPVQPTTYPQRPVQPTYPARQQTFYPEQPQANSYAPQPQPNSYAPQPQPQQVSYSEPVYAEASAVQPPPMAACTYSTSAYVEPSAPPAPAVAATPLYQQRKNGYVDSGEERKDMNDTGRQYV